MAKKGDVFFPDRIVGGRFVTSAVKALIHDYEDQQVEVCIRPRRKYTSNPQMRYYRGMVIRMLGDHLRDLGITGPNGAPINDEEVHQMCAGRFLVKTVFVDPDTGECMNIVLSTTRLTTGEMTEYIECIRKWCWDTFELSIPDPVSAADRRLA